jgi:hypothetical protein
MTEPLRKRLLWFAAYWVLGVGALAAVGLAIRAAIG